MKLDSKIIEGKKPLDCFDAENKELIKPFLNKEGYFSNNLADYCFLNKCPKRFLSNVFKELRSCFAACINGGDGGDWKYFLPAEWVKPEEKPEKKYRAFSLNEFSELYAIGDVVTYRIKDCEVVERSMLIGFQSSDDDEDAPGDAFVLIGNCRYGLRELFNNYELKHLNHWQPFGVIDVGE